MTNKLWIALGGIVLVVVLILAGSVSENNRETKENDDKAEKKHTEIKNNQDSIQENDNIHHTHEAIKANDEKDSNKKWVAIGSAFLGACAIYAIHKWGTERIERIDNEEAERIKRTNNEKAARKLLGKYVGYTYKDFANKITEKEKLKEEFSKVSSWEFTSKSHKFGISEDNMTFSAWCKEVAGLLDGLIKYNIYINKLKYFKGWTLDRFANKIKGFFTNVDNLEEAKEQANQFINQFILPVSIGKLDEKKQVVGISEDNMTFTAWCKEVAGLLDDLIKYNIYINKLKDYKEWKPGQFKQKIKKYFANVDEIGDLEKAEEDAYLFRGHFLKAPELTYIKNLMNKQENFDIGIDMIDSGWCKQVATLLETSIIANEKKYIPKYSSGYKYKKWGKNQFKKEIANYFSDKTVKDRYDLDSAKIKANIFRGQFLKVSKLKLIAKLNIFSIGKSMTYPEWGTSIAVLLESQIEKSEKEAMVRLYKSYRTKLKDYEQWDEKQFDQKIKRYFYDVDNIADVEKKQDEAYEFRHDFREVSEFIAIGDLGKELENFAIGGDRTFPDWCEDIYKLLEELIIQNAEPVIYKLYQNQLNTYLQWPKKRFKAEIEKYFPINNIADPKEKAYELRDKFLSVSKHEFGGKWGQKQTMSSIHEDKSITFQAWGKEVYDYLTELIEQDIYNAYKKRVGEYVEWEKKDFEDRVDKFFSKIDNIADLTKAKNEAYLFRRDFLEVAQLTFIGKLGKQTEKFGREPKKQTMTFTAWGKQIAGVLKKRIIENKEKNTYNIYQNKLRGYEDYTEDDFSKKIEEYFSNIKDPKYLRKAEKQAYEFRQDFEYFGNYFFTTIFDSDTKIYGINRDEKMTFIAWASEVSSVLAKLIRNNKSRKKLVNINFQNELKEAFPISFKIDKNYSKGTKIGPELKIIIDHTLVYKNDEKDENEENENNKPLEVFMFPEVFMQDIAQNTQWLDQFEYDHDLMNVLLEYLKLAEQKQQEKNLIQHVPDDKLERLFIIYPYIMREKILPEIKDSRKDIYNKLMNEPIGPSILRPDALDNPKAAREQFCNYFKKLFKERRLFTKDGLDKYLKEKRHSLEHDYFHSDHKLLDGNGHYLDRVRGADYVGEFIGKFGLKYIKVIKPIVVIDTKGKNIFTAEGRIDLYGILKSKDLRVYTPKAVEGYELNGINKTRAMKEMYQLVTYTGWADSHAGNMITGTTKTLKEPAILLFDLKAGFMSNDPFSLNHQKIFTAVDTFRKSTRLSPANDGKKYDPQVVELYNSFFNNILRLNSITAKVTKNSSKGCPISEEAYEGSIKNGIRERISVTMQVITNNKGEEVLEEVKSDE